MVGTIDKTKVKIALTEVEAILNELSMQEFNKIPDEIIDFIDENKDTNYKWEYDYDKSLENQNLSEYTLEILAYINNEYLLSDEQKKVMENIFELNDQKEKQDNYQWHMNEVNTENYQKEIIEIEKLIPKLGRQYKKLSIEDIIDTYSKDINDLKNKLEGIVLKKQLLEPQVSSIEDEKYQQWVLEESIKKNTEIMENSMQTNNSEIENQVNNIADLWTTIMNEDASKRGIMKVKARFYSKSNPGEPG